MTPLPLASFVVDALWGCPEPRVPWRAWAHLAVSLPHDLSYHYLRPLDSNICLKTQDLGARKGNSTHRIGALLERQNSELGSVVTHALQAIVRTWGWISEEELTLLQGAGTFPQEAHSPLYPSRL